MKKKKNLDILSFLYYPRQMKHSLFLHNEKFLVKWPLFSKELMMSEANWEAVVHLSYNERITNSDTTDCFYIVSLNIFFYVKTIGK